MKPNFLIIGAPKCGTTTLWHELRKHPDVFMPQKKEINFFTGNFLNQGLDTFVNWKGYESLFLGAGSSIAIGEASPTYSEVTLYPEAPARIAQFLPDARLIYIVRHPLRRMVSHWQRNVFTGRLPPDTFNDAVRMYRTVIDPTLYFSCVQAYRGYFSDDRILVIFLEDLQSGPDETLNRCFAFLGVEPIARKLARDPPRNTVQDKARRTRTLRVIQHTPDWLLPRRLVPAPIKNFIHTRLTQPAPTPVWDPAIKRWAIRQIEDEAKKLLQYAGKPENFWNLQETD